MRRTILSKKSTLPLWQHFRSAHSIQFEGVSKLFIAQRDADGAPAGMVGSHRRSEASSDALAGVAAHPSLSDRLRL